MRDIHIYLAAVAFLLVGCDFQREADSKFGDQHFKTVVALVELHKLRTGAYPSSLDTIKHTGSWDVMAIHSVEYKKLDSGYELNLTRGWVGRPTITYPPDFWQGLGVVRSNLRPGT